MSEANGHTQPKHPYPRRNSPSPPAFADSPTFAKPSTDS